MDAERGSPRSQCLRDIRALKRKHNLSRALKDAAPCFEARRAGHKFATPALAMK